MTKPNRTDQPETQTAAADAAADAAGQAAKAGEPVTPETAAAEAKAAPSPDDLLAEAKAKAAENYNHYLRAMADLENFRRRAVREKEELRQFAASQVLEDLLPVLDNLGLGLAAAEQPNATIKTLREGVAMVQAQLRGALEKHGLKEINPAGQAFDAHQHEAVSHMPSATVPDHHVMEVVRTGYVLNGRLLRPATVVVSSGAPQAGAKA